MDDALASLLQTCGLPRLEIDTAVLAAVAKDGGRVVLLKDGRPVAAVVSLEDLGFVLDADAAVHEDTIRGDEDLPSGSHRAWGH